MSLYTGQKKGYMLAIAAGAVCIAGWYSFIGAFATGEWRWLAITLVAYLIMRRT